MDLSQIKQRIEVMEKIKADIKTAKNMLKDASDNDTLYQEAVEEAKVGVNKKKQLRDEIYNQPENKKLVDQIKKDAEELQVLNEMLSEELIEYRQEHKTESIEGLDGKLRHFKLSVRLTSTQNGELPQDKQ